MMQEPADLKKASRLFCCAYPFNSPKLKKKMDQKKLNTSWMPYTVRALPVGFCDVTTR